MTFACFTRVENFHKTQTLFLDFVERFVAVLVVIDPEQKVLEDVVVFHAHVIGTVDLDLFDVGLDDAGIVAQRFDEEQLVAHLIDDDFANQPASFYRRVGSVKHLEAAQVQHKRQ